MKINGLLYLVAGTGDLPQTHVNQAEPLNLKAKRRFELAGAGVKRTCHEVYHFLVYGNVLQNAILVTFNCLETLCLKKLPVS